MKQINQTSFTSWIFLLSLATIWGVNFLFIKLAVEEIGPITNVFLRLLMASIILYVVMKLQNQKLVLKPKLILFYFILGAFGLAIPFSLISSAEIYINAGLAGVLMSPMPLLTLALSAIILKNLSSKEIFSEIEKLILDKKRLLKLQKLNFNNFIFNHKYISAIIDNIRDEFLSLNLFNIKKKNNFKIMHITNINERFNGRLHYNTGRRINNGFIRNGHNVLTLSDRDTVHYQKRFGDFKGDRILQKKIIETFNNFKPNILVLGHADRVSNKTLEIIKDSNKDIKIVQWFLDPLSKFGPDHKNNSKRILDKINFIDYTFLTTDPGSLPIKIPNSFFIPNPSDKSFEILENYKKNCTFDVFFAMSHGVHRGALKSGKEDDREKFINKLINLNKNLKFDVYGMNNVQPVWADQFLRKISNAYMGINLSRGKPIKYYSSDRIVQLVGNGLLTFIDKNTFLSDFFSNKEIIFYKDINDLSEKLNKFKKDKKTGKQIAKRGRNKYLKYFNSDLVAEYILSKTFDYKLKKKIIWDK